MDVLLVIMGRIGENCGLVYWLVVPRVAGFSSHETFLLLCGSGVKVPGSSGTCLGSLVEQGLNAS